MESKENEETMPEILEPIIEKNLNFMERTRALNERARAKLPKEIKDKLSPIRLIAEGFGKTALGLSVDMIEGATLASLTFGLSEVFPISELAADFGTVKLAEAITQRPVRQNALRWGYLLSVLPVIGDFASPTFFDGLTDIYIGTKALMGSVGNNEKQLSLDSTIK